MNAKLIHNAIIHGTLSDYQKTALLSYIEWKNEWAQAIEKAGGIRHTIKEPLPLMPDEVIKLESSIGMENIEKLASEYQDKTDTDRKD